MNILYRARPLLILGACLSAQHSAYADSVIKTIGFWSLSETTDGRTCYISIDNMTYGGGDILGGSNEATVSFTISKEKNRPERPVEVMIRYASGKNRSSAAFAEISGANTITAIDITGNRTSFWGISKTLSSFFEQLKKGNSVKVSPNGKGEKAVLNSSAFKDILEAMESRCNDGRKVLNTEFEKSFFESLSDLNANSVDTAKGQALRKLYYTAFEAFFHISNANNELQKILDSYKPFQDELNTNRDERNNIQNSKLPATKDLLAKSLKQQVDSQADIDQLQIRINSLIEKIKISQKAFDDAKAAIAPFEPKYNDITQRLSNSKSTLQKAQSRLKFIDQRIADLKETISNLNDEYRRLYDGLSVRQSRMNDAYSAYTEASRRRQMFDPQREFRDRLERDWGYRQAIQERNQAHNDTENSRASLNQYIAIRNGIQVDSNKCHAGQMVQAVQGTLNKISNVMNMQMAPGDGPGRDGPGRGGPGRGGPGGQPPQPQPEPQQPSPQPLPASDCTMIDNALVGANERVNNQQIITNQYADRERMLQGRVQDIEFRTRQQVDREYSSLVDYERQTQYEYQSRYNEYTSDRNHLEQINSTDLPQAKNELNDLSNERPQVIDRINNSTNDVNNITTELVNFKNSCDWDNKVNQVNNTGSVLAKDQGDLKDTQNAQAKARSSLQDGITTESRARKTIDDLNSRTVTLDQRAEVLNEKLSHLPGERAKFDVYLEEQKAIFNKSRNDFASTQK